MTHGKGDSSWATDIVRTALVGNGCLPKRKSPNSLLYLSPRRIVEIRFPAITHDRAAAFQNIPHAKCTSESQGIWGKSDLRYPEKSFDRNGEGTLEIISRRRNFPGDRHISLRAASSPREERPPSHAWHRKWAWICCEVDTAPRSVTTIGWRIPKASSLSAA